MRRAVVTTGGDPVIDVPGLTPRSSLRSLGPVLVTVEPASTEKVPAVPRPSGVTAAGPGRQRQHRQQQHGARRSSQRCHVLKRTPRIPAITWLEIVPMDMAAPGCDMRTMARVRHSMAFET